MPNIEIIRKAHVDDREPERHVGVRVLLRVVLSKYLRWDIDHDEYQIAFFEALTKFPFLTSVTVFTGFKVSSIE